MVDNRYATALVIGSVLSLLASVYLSVAVGTQHWYQYRSLPASNDASNASDLKSLKETFIDDVTEKSYSEALFRLNGTLGLWWRCILVPENTVWPQQPGVNMVTKCKAFTLPQQFETKFKHPGNFTGEQDVLRTYLWRCQFLFPLVSLGLVFLGALIGVCACLCRSITPTLFVGLLHLLAGMCSLATVCCFLAGIDLLHRASDWSAFRDHSMGWSLYLALISAPLQMMAAALFIWAARSHRKNYTRMTAYRVA
ncbi:claudin domain-containing protein 1b [Electrophorus electricus]|uniref:Claudin domain containing 1a n=1 Tax=Electrophorus electricus TaxID=8005 RepID=A0A4W4E755_ELEEL|nr:claudin domain-containing protein 1b [Electrophorus electricus]XP_026876260.2 claudin domain-containing protein 1b [Electrophorus electricus]XP_026876261.2 claudin domain-containing protein 1b [Electrophorus electricus]